MAERDGFLAHGDSIPPSWLMTEAAGGPLEEKLSELDDGPDSVIIFRQVCGRQDVTLLHAVRAGERPDTRGHEMF